MELSGQLMSGDTVVAEIVKGHTTPVEQARMPLYLARGGSFEEWLVSRAVDSSRPNSRMLKKVLKLRLTDDVSTVLHAHAATVTDNFWFREEGEALTWDKVKFRENHFVDLALSGKFLAYQDEGLEQLRRSHTPELTNIGSYEKAWQLEDGAWYLYKSGNVLERFSELFICQLGKRLGFDMAEYLPDRQYVKTRDFTEGKYNFDPAAAILDDSVDEAENYRKMRALNPTVTKAYLDMIYLDALVFNFDRHTYNFGFLRDQQTGAVLKLAPNFDNNIALISRGYAGSPTGSNGMLIRDFLTLLESADEPYPIPEQLSERELRDMAAATLPREEIDRGFVVTMLLDRQQRLYQGMAQEQALHFDLGM